jgi:hypothetical protein
MGKALYHAMKLQQIREEQEKAQQLKKSNQQYQLDPILPLPLVSPLLDPKSTVHVTNSTPPLLSQPETIDSETFIGRNLLLKMGWEHGKKLGKSGETANAPIEVHIRHDNSGLGIQPTERKRKFETTQTRFQSSDRQYKS